MFGIGLPELILILIVALLVVGPKKLPELARSLGKAMHDVKSMTEDVKQTFVGDDIDLEANPDNDEQKIARKPDSGPQTPQKDDKTGPDTADHSPDTIKSDPYGNLRG